MAAATLGAVDQLPVWTDPSTSATLEDRLLRAQASLATGAETSKLVSTGKWAAKIISSTQAHSEDKDPIVWAGHCTNDLVLPKCAVATSVSGMIAALTVKGGA